MVLSWFFFIPFLCLPVAFVPPSHPTSPHLNVARVWLGRSPTVHSPLLPVLRVDGDSLPQPNITAQLCGSLATAIGNGWVGMVLHQHHTSAMHNIHNYQLSMNLLRSCLRASLQSWVVLCRSRWAGTIQLIMPQVSPKYFICNSNVSCEYNTFLPFLTCSHAWRWELLTALKCKRLMLRLPMKSATCNAVQPAASQASIDNFLCASNSAT